ncbi:MULTISPECIES: nucleoside triphosphate pyrophosphatase [Terrabacteria group]|uniref:Maf family protein n=1 Tax=Bacillati TaxID=1783272 RepID=UPI001939983D|nr:MULTISPECIES: Maf family protein [Terrabacteria group]MBW9212840.1 Maf family protein [Trueperella sp. zg.1013]QRG86406.1 septum formation protein Maf [Bulleidia sp. zg-1006]
MKEIILASKSPRRKELMETLGLPFSIMVSNTKEEWYSNLKPNENSLNIAKEKAEAIFLQKPEAIIIASDTIVLKDNLVFGKPKDVKDARRMLQELSNSVHQVYTSVVVRKGNQVLSAISVSDVYFLEIPDDELELYLKGSEWKDKAGAYAIQAWAARYIDKIDGDYYAIMGFPVSKVNSLLKQIL